MCRLRVIAIIVSYRPSLGPLQCLLDALRPQVALSVLVDNGSDEDVAGWIARTDHENLHCLELAANYGVAAAQNAGIRCAREAGATHVILFDQDSEPAPIWWLNWFPRAFTWKPSVIKSPRWVRAMLIRGRIIRHRSSKYADSESIAKSAGMRETWSMWITWCLRDA